MLSDGEEWPVPPASIRVEDGPVFILSGKGKLATLTVYGPSSGTRIARPDPFNKCAAVWEIECEHGLLMGARMEDLRMPCGTIPSDCHQTVPTPVQSPPHLASGSIYHFNVWSNLAGGLGGDFYLDRLGAVLPVDVDGCAMMNAGGWVRVNCKTGAPFVEPTDIEALVREHRRKGPFTPPPDPAHHGLRSRVD